MLDLKFGDSAWDDYLWWQSNDQRTLKRLNKLIEETRRTPFEGIGKPERLRHHGVDVWSRRITSEHRLIYAVADDDTLVVLALKYHYKD